MPPGDDLLEGGLIFGGVVTDGFSGVSESWRRVDVVVFSVSR